MLLVVAALGWLLAPAAPEVHGAATERFAVRLTVPTRSVEPWTVEVDGPDGRPAAVDVVLEPVMTGMGHALAPVAARPESTGRYRADVALPMAGQWEITVRLRDGVGAERAVFTVLR